MYKRISPFILELLFPTQCLVCEEHGKYLCGECFDRIPINPINLCPICQKQETFAGRVCNVCENEQNKIYLDGVIVASYYKHPIMRDAVYRYKYNFIKKLHFPLSKILLKKICTLADFPFEQFFLVPVPLHHKRLAWRGFNQSELLCKNLQRLFQKEGLGIGFSANLLLRNKEVKPQMSIKSTTRRKKNISGCFSLNKGFSKKLPEKIILVDDVITTGATLEECAKTLKRNGVQKVWGLVLARQGK